MLAESSDDCSLPQHMWSQPSPDSFAVRGINYLTDKIKYAASKSVFKLHRIDLFDCEEPTHNIASYPYNRVTEAQKRGDSSWFFVINFMIPGPPYLGFVIYFLGDQLMTLHCFILK